MTDTAAISELLHEAARRTTPSSGRDVRPLLAARGVTYGDAARPVRGQHPAVLGVRLPDVHDEERDVVGVAVVQRLQRAHLGAEGRSGIRAEHERDGAYAREARQPHRLPASEWSQLEVEGEIARGELRR